MYLKISVEQKNLVVKSNKKQWYFSMENISVITLVLFYTVGLIGLSLPIRDNFALLTPLNLLISLGIVLANHKYWTKAFMSVFIFIFLGGFFSEIIGVQTGWVFGNYEYGQTLGFKLFNVPLILGVNWLMLIYASAMVVNLLWKRFPLVLKALIAALLMVGLDVLIEPVAMELDFWNWENGIIPFQNFIGWFVIAFALQLAFFSVISKKMNNHAAVVLFALQVVFFGTLNLIL
jgi:putative membrane protein